MAADSTIKTVRFIGANSEAVAPQGAKYAPGLVVVRKTIKHLAVERKEKEV